VKPTIRSQIICFCMFGTLTAVALTTIKLSYAVHAGMLDRIGSPQVFTQTLRSLSALAIVGVGGCPLCRTLLTTDLGKLCFFAHAVTPPDRSISVFSSARMSLLLRMRMMPV
jgi:hypothetical protein